MKKPPYPVLPAPPGKEARTKHGAESLHSTWARKVQTWSHLHRTQGRRKDAGGE